MTFAERKHAAELCRANWRGKVVVGVSSTAVPDCLDLLKHASEQVTTASNVCPLAAGISFVLLESKTMYNFSHVDMLGTDLTDVISAHLTKCSNCCVYGKMSA